KVYSAINISGLAAGISCFLLIMLYISDELSYDSFHEKGDRIYRVSEIYTQSGDIQIIANSSGPWGPGMLFEFPEVINYVRLKPPLTKYLVTYEDKHFYEERFVFADSTLFDVFDFKLIDGDKREVLNEPYKVVLTESAAEKYFGEENPLGKVITVDKQMHFTVTGIVEDCPKNSHFKFDFLASFMTLYNPIRRVYAGNIEFWLDRRGNIYTYILLEKGTSPVELSKKFQALMDKYGGEYIRRSGTLNTLMPMLQPLKSIHLDSHLEREWEPNGYLRHIYVFFIIAVLVMLTACFNYMNLSTARSAGRAQEVGLRKVVGADKIQLIRQFLGESIILTALATSASICIVYFFLPVFNNLTSKQLHLNFFLDWKLIPGIILLTLLVGIISGIYPAFFISAFHPVKILRGTIKSGVKSKKIRMILTVAQFSVSISLMISLGVVYDQINYIKNKDLGFDKENIITIPMPSISQRRSYPAFRDAILANADIKSVSGSNTLMGKPPITREVRPADAGDEENMSFRLVEVDYDFLKTYNIEIINGRDFSFEYGADTLTSVLVNEETARRMGLSPPVGKNINMIKPVRPKKVIGMVKDFHLESLHESIQPVIISPGKWWSYQYVSIRISGENIPETLSFIREKWIEIYPDNPFEYSFFESYLDSLYDSETRLGKLFIYFTFLALMIAFLGLFGLASFTVEQRTKEIGIRRVLGSSVGSIINLHCREFIVLISVSNLIAWPVGYISVRNWLSNFPYQTEISISIFIISGLLALLIALLTISYQSLKVARLNPVDLIRHD
ncbi:MAG: FtsX-like permease family protein, partial [bacterium]|nr:FtsX-like permease family protein [bacterium]